MPGHVNALIHEKSPYLLQHAHNPVDWLPWGEAALSKAAAEDKPIFLSIGYSTCHWCHVMERECFEDDDVARLMNETFVCIKVDREERPDLDSVYMLACQAMTGRGGWPLNVLLTPDGLPFFATTYMPKASKLGHMGMLDFVPKVREMWATGREQAEQGGRQVSEALAGAAANAAKAAKGMPGEGDLREAYHRLSGSFDMRNGGFGDAPKFPSPHNFLFLLRHYKRTGELPARAMTERTLSSMRLGGIFDQVGLGFHRYSTDAAWLLPHFEKMLYDQGMLALAYTEAAQAMDSPVLAQTAREVLTYVLRDLVLPEGVFACGEDADSEGVEGKFYVWKEAEIRRILDPDDATLFLRAFHFEPMGNFADEATGIKNGENIPHLGADLGRISEELGIDADEFDERLDRVLRKVLEARSARVRPGRDDKALTDWNGLTIAALARAGFVLGEQAFLEAARKAAGFLLQRMDDGQGGLLHRYRDGEAAIPGFLDDYAYLCWGLIELYQAEFDPAWLVQAIRLMDAAVDRFNDPSGGFFLTSGQGEKLFMRPKEPHDGAMPSGSSVATVNLLRLAGLTGRADYRKLAEKALHSASALIQAMPTGFAFMLCAVEALQSPPVTVTISARDAADPRTKALLDALRRTYLPDAAFHLRTEATRQALAKLAPYTDGQLPLEDTPTAYVCSQGQCVSMIHDPAALEAILRGEEKA